MAKSFATFVALLFLCFVVLSPTEVKVVEAKLCQKRSQTWTGICIWSDNCDEQCRLRENAVSGSCHQDKRGFACFCYFKHC